MSFPPPVPNVCTLNFCGSVSDMVSRPKWRELFVRFLILPMELGSLYYGMMPNWLLGLEEGEEGRTSKTASAPNDLQSSWFFGEAVVTTL